MKSSRSNSFFMETRAAKRRKIGETIFELLPREMWLEIIKHLDKKTFRELTAVCKGLHQFASDYRLWLDASWPVIDYSDRQSSVVSRFHWDSMGEQNYNKPKIFSFKNSDIAIGMSDGRLIVLKFGEKQWKVFGKHQIKQNNGKWRGFPIHDVVLLESGEIISCGVDGIRVWDRVLAKQKYHIKLPKNANWSSRPHRLLELSQQKVACGCWDGNVAILSKPLASLDIPYQYDGLLEIGDDKEIHRLNNLTLCENELIGEYSQFINRWDLKSGKLKNRIEFKELRDILFKSLLSSGKSEVSVRMILKVGEADIHEKDVMKLNFDWRYPHGVVRIDVNSETSFLVNLHDLRLIPYYLGSNARLVVTDKKDILHFHLNSCVFFDWNFSKNQFNAKREVPEYFRFDQSLLLSSGCILFFDFNGNKRVGIFNPLDKSVMFFDLEVPPSCRVANMKYFISDNHLIGYGVNYDTMNFWNYFVWDLSSGKLLCSLPSIHDELMILPSGEFLNVDDSLKLDYPYNGLFEKNEEITVFRFNLRK